MTAGFATGPSRSDRTVPTTNPKPTEAGVLGEFVSSAWRTVERTVQSGEQLVGRKVALVETDDHQQGVMKLANYAGNATAQLGMMTLLNLGVGKILKLTEAAGVIGNNAARTALLQQAAAGGIYGGLLTPVEKKESPWHRFAQAGIDAGTFATVHGASNAFGNIYARGLLTNAAESVSNGIGARWLTMAAGIGDRAVMNLASGVGGGLANTALSQADNVLQGKPIATFSDMASDIGGFAIGNAILGETSRTAGNLMPKGPTHELPYTPKMKDEFASLTNDQMQTARDLVLRDLTNVSVSDGYGNWQPAAQRLLQDPILKAPQKDFTLTALANVREHYANLRVDGKQIADQAVNWIHTQGEMTRVLESAQANRLSSTETQDSVVGAMFSDAAKYGPTAVTRMNFWTHHLEGAAAAREVLPRYGYPPQRVDMIATAILNHQVGPPEFMGMFYRFKMQMAINEALKKAAEGSPEQARLEHLQQVLNDETVDSRFGKAFRPLAQQDRMPAVRNSHDQYVLRLTDDQRALLRLTGNDDWYVARDPRQDADFYSMSPDRQQRLLSVYRMSRALIDGDSIDNYATLNGVSKYLVMRGPDTLFSDDTVWDSIRSVDASYQDVQSVVSRPMLEKAQQHWLEKHRILFDETNGIRAQMNAWLRSIGRDRGEPIPFYNAPLTYPAAGKTWQDLTLQQQADFEFAKTLRAKMVELLRQATSTTGQTTDDFESVSRRSIVQRLDIAQT